MRQSLRGHTEDVVAKPSDAVHEQLAQLGQTLADQLNRLIRDPRVGQVEGPAVYLASITILEETYVRLGTCGRILAIASSLIGTHLYKSSLVSLGLTW